MSPKLQEIDPDEDFIVYRHKICPVQGPGPIGEIDGIIYKNYGTMSYEVLWTPKTLLAFSNVIRGIAIMNDNMLFHNDVKPDNIIMDENENFRIIDLGTALSPSDSGFIVNMSSELRQRDWFGWKEDPKYEAIYDYVYNHRLYADISAIFKILESEARFGYADIGANLKHAESAANRVLWVLLWIRGRVD